MLKLNLPLLEELCLINSPSGLEFPMTTYIINYCYQIKGIQYKIDKVGNLFITKNTTSPKTYPCLIAHMDEIHNLNIPRKIMLKNNLIWAVTEDTKQPCGLGADDKFGICIILQLLKILPDIKVCFTVQEESYGIGAIEAQLNSEFFSNIRFMIEPDRRGNSDIIVETNCLKIASDEFLEDISDLLQKYKYKPAIGTFTDIGVLKKTVNVSAINLSCGYYKEHTSREYGHLNELEKCLNLIYDIINKAIKVYVHDSPGKAYCSWYYDTYGDDGISNLDNYSTISYAEASYICHNCKEHDCSKCKIWEIAR